MPCIGLIGGRASPRSWWQAFPSCGPTTRSSSLGGLGLSSSLCNQGSAHRVGARLGRFRRAAQLGSGVPTEGLFRRPPTPSHRLAALVASEGLPGSRPAPVLDLTRYATS